MQKFKTRDLTVMAALVAAEIVLSRFLSFSAWNMKIGFSFLPVAAAAMLLGPIPAGIVAALGDFIGAVLFPIGAYFPGFTLTAFLTGCCFGVFLFREQSLRRVLAAVAVNQLAVDIHALRFAVCAAARHTAHPMRRAFPRAVCDRLTYNKKRTYKRTAAENGMTADKKTSKRMLTDSPFACFLCSF